jgi:hypothetical protein
LSCGHKLSWINKAVAAQHLTHDRAAMASFVLRPCDVNWTLMKE